MAKLITNNPIVVEIRQRSVDFAVRIIEAKAKDLVGAPTKLGEDAIEIAKAFEEYINMAD
jgi:hypothetical protein